MLPLVINARFLTQPVTGVQRHAIEVSRRLKQALPATRFVTPRGVIHADLAGELAAEETGRLRGHAWEQLELPRQLRGAGLVSLCNAAPVAVARQVVTIHDAAPFAVPQAYSPAFRRWYRFMIRRLGARAAAVMTDSAFSAAELQRHAGIAPAKLVVVPLGTDHVRAVQSDRSVIARHGLDDRPFLLAVGSSSPHKNHAALLRAAERLGGAGFRIVVAGGVSARVHATASAIGSDGTVRHVGRVSDGELRGLYEAAAGYVHPSYYEGFGLPPLEAMALGCPVVSARAASLPEVLGDAAVYFDPFDDADIAATIARFMADDADRTARSERGRAHAAGFTWDRTAERVLAIAHAALG